MYPARCAIPSTGKSVSRCPRRSALRYLVNSAAKWRGKSARRFPARPAVRLPAKPVPRSLASRKKSSAARFPAPIASRCPRESAPTCLVRVAKRWSGKSATTYPGSNVSRLRSKHVEMYPASNARRNVPTLTLVRSARSKTPTEFRPPIQSPPILPPESNPHSFSSCHTTAHILNTTLQQPPAQPDPSAYFFNIIIHFVCTNNATFRLFFFHSPRMLDVYIYYIISSIGVSAQ